MKSPRPEARARARTGAASGSAAASAARAARPPAGARRARRPATRSPVGFEGGQMPLQHARARSCRGFNNPFRVEYQAINLDVIEATGLDEVTPETLHAQRPRPQGRPGQGARPGRDHPRGDRQGPRVLEVGRGGHHRRRAVRVEILPLPFGRRPPARQGQPAHQPLSARPQAPPVAHVQELGRCSSSLKNMFKVPDLRNKILFTLLMIALYRFGAHIPVPGIDLSAVKTLQEQAEERRRARLPAAVLGRRAHPVRRVRARDHAVHHQLDHHADPRRW